MAIKAALTESWSGYNTHLKTGLVRLSFPHLFEKFEKSGKYQAQFYVDKNDKATIKLLNEAIENAKEHGKDAKWGGKIPLDSKITISVKDGDEDADEFPAQEGAMIITAKSERKPKVLDIDGSEMFDQEDIYPGCYVQAIVEAYPYNADGKKGIAFALLGVKKMKDGERLGGGGSTVEDSDFDEAEDDDDDDLGI